MTVLFDLIIKNFRTKDSSKRTKNTKKILQVLQSLILTCLATSGCASLPEVGPFVDASRGLQAAVSTTGKAVEQELRDLGDDSNADQLKSHWKARNMAFAGMVDYSTSLQAIVEAGNKGSDSAGKVADSVNSLASAAGVTLPGSPEAAAVATDIAKYLYSQIAMARSAKSLEKSMEATRPAISSIAEHIEADFKDMEVILVAANRNKQTELLIEYSQKLDYRTDIESKLIEELDPDDTEALDRQVKLAQLLEDTNQWYQEYDSKQKALEDRSKLGQALINSSAQSTKDWSLAHSQLIDAIKDRRPINIDSLVQASTEIRTLIKKIREL